MRDTFQFAELLYSYYDASIRTLALPIDGFLPRWLQARLLCTPHVHLDTFPVQQTSRVKAPDTEAGRDNGGMGLNMAYKTSRLVKDLDAEGAHIPPGYGLE